MKNDELMRRLFRWRSHIQFEDVDFYLRVVGDQVVEDARQAALIESRKVRRAMRDENSNDFLVYIDPIRDLTDEELIGSLVILAAGDVMRDYKNNTPKIPVEPLPDNPTLEQQETHQAALEDREVQYIEAMQAYVENWRATFTEGLKAKTRDQLEKQYARYRIDRVCEDIFNREFENHLLAGSVYTDDTYTQRMFTVEEYKSLPNEVREVIKDAYSNITIQPDAIKN